MIIHRIACTEPRCALMVETPSGEIKRLSPLQVNDGSNVFEFRVDGYPEGTHRHYARGIKADGSSGERGPDYEVTV